MRNKAQVQIIAPAILALVFAAIVLVFGLIMTQELRDTDIVKTDAGASGTITNESINSTHGLTRTLEALTLFPNGGCGSVLAVYNGSHADAGIPINTGNYSVSGCVITNTTDTFSNQDVEWLVTYEYTRSGEAYESANKTISGLGTFADFWEIIVLAIIITVVIGLLLVIFGSKGRR